MKKSDGAVAQRHAREQKLADEVFRLFEERFPLLEKERSKAAHASRQRDLLIIAAALENVDDHLDRLSSGLAAADRGALSDAEYKRLMRPRSLGRKEDPLHDRDLSQLAAEVIRKEFERNERQLHRQRRLSVDGVHVAFVELRVRGVAKTRCYALIAERLITAGCQVSADAIKQAIDPRWTKLSDADFSRENQRWE